MNSSEGTTLDRMVLEPFPFSWQGRSLFKVQDCGKVGLWGERSWKGASVWFLLFEQSWMTPLPPINRHEIKVGFCLEMSRPAASVVMELCFQPLQEQKECFLGSGCGTPCRSLQTNSPYLHSLVLQPAHLPQAKPFSSLQSSIPDFCPYSDLSFPCYYFEMFASYMMYFHRKYHCISPKWKKILLNKTLLPI